MELATLEISKITQSGTLTLTESLLLVKLVSWPVPVTLTLLVIFPTLITWTTIFKVTRSLASKSPTNQTPVSGLYWPLELMNLTPSGNKSPTVTLNDLSGPLLTTTIVYSIISKYLGTELFTSLSTAKSTILTWTVVLELFPSGCSSLVTLTKLKTSLSAVSNILTQISTVTTVPVSILPKSRLPVHEPLFTPSTAYVAPSTSNNLLSKISLKFTFNESEDPPAITVTMKWAVSPGFNSLISASLITTKVVLAITLTVSLSEKLPLASSTPVVILTVFKTSPRTEALTLALK